MKLNFCLLTVPFLFLGGCSQLSQTEEREYIDLPTVEIEHEYLEIKDFELSWESLFDPQDEEYFVYFYSPTCNHCNELKNYIIEKALLNRNIYFVKGSNKVILRDDVFSTIGQNSPENMAILGFPACIKVVNHLCKKNVAGVTQIKELIK